MKTISLGLRDWAWLTPLALGEIDLSPLSAFGLTLELSRVPTLPGSSDNPFDLAETSLSRHATETAQGTTPRQGVPFFPMQAFRHRCALVARGSQAHSASDLEGTRVGLTGWHDSGNIWTRDALRHDGLSTETVQWFAGPLSAGGPAYDRVGPGRDRGDVHAINEGSTLVEKVEAGELDALLTPFMPTQVYGPDATLRPLYAASAGPELAYYADRGYVPGIHLLTAAPELPMEIARAVVQVLVSSRSEWRSRRSRMQDEPVLAVDTAYQQQLSGLNRGWDAPGLPSHRPMIERFLGLQVEEGIISDAPSVDDLFAITTDWED